jgi:hypothetical protein
MTVQGPQEVASRFFPSEEDDQQRAALCEAIEALLAGEDETTPGARAGHLGVSAQAAPPLISASSMAPS